MDAPTVNFLLTLFIATFTATGALWLILALSGQATMNTIPVEPPTDDGGDNDGFIWS